MYEVGKTEKNPHAKRLALIINKNFSDYVEIFENQSIGIISCKIKSRGQGEGGRHHHKIYKFMPLQVIMTVEMRKLWTRNPVGITF